METDQKIEAPSTTHLTPIAKLRSIMSGELTVKLHLEFLFRNNRADLLILKNTKVRRRVDGAILNDCRIL